MEKEIRIATGDNHFIYGNLAGGKSRSRKLVIFCHGFTGNRNEHIFFNGAKFFSENGYDTFRFDFYNDQKKARHFEETSISQHGSDITAVVNHFKKKYDKIYLVGHSFGGTSLLFANHESIVAMVFWDASYVVSRDEKSFFKTKNPPTIDFGIRVIVGKRFTRELFDFPDCGALIAAVHVPVKFIGAGRGNFTDSKKYYDHANQPKSLSKIAAADHCFNTLKSEAKLLEETLDWLRKF